MALKRVLLFCFLVCSLHLSADEQDPAFTVYIPMRDGAALPTDIYLPPGKSSDLPCVLIRTPAGRTRYKDAYVPLTKGGYVVAIQDARSYIDPEGKTMPCVNDGWGSLQDGYDTVQWLANSTITNGKVGTIGFSAMGMLQLLMAPSAPSGLFCQYIGVAPASMYHHAMFNGGQLCKHQVEGWLGYYAKHPSILQTVVDQSQYNSFWEALDTTKVAHKVKVPAIHYGGWFDTFSQGTIDAFVARQENGGEGAKGKQKLVMGPWGHFWPMVDTIGDYKIPEAGLMPPVDISAKRWFDYHLKELDNGIASIPNVTYYVMGPLDGSPSSGNVWKTADSWPVPAEETAFYLTGKSSLTQSPSDADVDFSFVYNPEDPYPTTGGRNLFLESGPKDLSALEKRDDVVVFTSEELKKDLEVTGRVKAKVWFSTDREDTDLVVKLCDVYPDGKSILITDGIIRLGNIANIGEPNKPQEIEVDLWSTSIVFAKGHKIRLIVTSSDYPRYEKNLNVLKCAEGQTCAVAHNHIHTGRKHPSKVVLPVVYPKKKAMISVKH